jgi:predicted HTH transcriptional regulator
MILAGFDEKFITKVKLASKNCYILKFYGPNFILFGKEIKLTHPEKQAILEFQINRHLNHAIPQPKEKRIAKILELLKEPLTSIQIAQKLGISQTYTEVYLRELIRKGLVIKFKVRGKNKIAYISRLNYSSRTAAMP